MKAAIKSLGDTDFGGGSVRVISLDKGNATSLAEERTRGSLDVLMSTVAELIIPEPL